MAFRDFTFPEVGEQLGLAIRDGDLFPNPPALAVRQDFMESIREGFDLAQAISTEKAKSEFVIAPVLFELRRMTNKRFKLFSGTEWKVDPDRGLNGYFDFLLTWGLSQYYVSAPFAAVVEAKNDLLPTGLGQCIATMYAATVANEKAKQPIFPISGVVSTGSVWKFLQLQGNVVILDDREFQLTDLPRLFGVLDLITRVPAAIAA
jgi:hypothetical protein